MIATVENQTISLAGLFQATEIVQSIANTGDYHQGNARAILDSLFELDADSVGAVFGSKHQLRAGMRRLATQLGGNDDTPDMQITHYALALLKIERRLQHASDAMDRIRRGIEEVKKLRQHYDTLDENITDKLANIYSQNISTISPRVIVHGNQDYLKQPEHANRIRALLLGGLRSAVLWRQCGGSRWKLLTNRQKYVRQAEHDLRDGDHLH
jgi:high frequency lysogenization protein